MLHVPSGWWHLVVNLESGIALTQNFVPEAHLAEVLSFLRDRPEQVTGFGRDVADPYGLFVERLEERCPELLRRAAAELGRRKEKGRARKAAMGRGAGVGRRGNGAERGRLHVWVWAWRRRRDPVRTHHKAGARRGGRAVRLKMAASSECAVQSRTMRQGVDGWIRTSHTYSVLPYMSVILYLGKVGTYLLCIHSACAPLRTRDRVPQSRNLGAGVGGRLEECRGSTTRAVGCGGALCGRRTASAVLGNTRPPAIAEQIAALVEAQPGESMTGAISYYTSYPAARLAVAGCLIGSG